MIDSVHNEGGGFQIAKFDPNRLGYDQDGIPILSTTEIETVATELLTRYCPEVLSQPSMTPVAAIIERLGQRTGLSFTMADLGCKGTAKILGKVNFSQKRLYLDCSLEGDLKAAFRFTAGHEIGHWVLHRYRYKNWKFKTGSSMAEELEDDERSLYRLKERTPSDWLEFQANVFAASLVTPRVTFIRALVETQKLMDIKRNFGRIYLSDEHYSRRDFKKIVERLSAIFQVSKKCVAVRIETLQLLEDFRKSLVKSPQSIAFICETIRTLSE